MRGSTTQYIVICLLLLANASCSVTRHVPEGERLLTRNVILEDKQAPRKERIKADQVERFIQPQANRRFLGTNLYISLYNMADPDTTNRRWWHRTMRRMGEAPVLLDSSLVASSAEIIRNYTVFSGFYEAHVDYSIDTSRNKKATVTYSITQNAPYRIGNIDYEFRDRFLAPIILQDTASSLLHSGEVLDGNVLSAERSRILNYLRNSGYYQFNLRDIEFVGDSTVGNRTVDVTLGVKQHLAGYTLQGEPIYENNSIYRISRIIVNPDYDPMRAVGDAYDHSMIDTAYYRGLEILHPRGRKSKVKSRVLRNAINIFPNELYSIDEVQQTSANIMRMGFYKNANIIFTEQQADSTSDNQVTYIGGDEEQTTAETTSERYMICEINCVPALRHSYRIELEGTTSSNFSGINATVGYQNRNFLRGSELFDISLKGGYEFVRDRSTNSSFEVGGTVSLSFPRFLAPFNIDRYNRAVNPRSKVELSVNTQRRRYYQRTISSASWGYSWSNRRGGTFTFKPIEMNLIKGTADSSFMNRLGNEYLRASYREQLVPTISGSYTYNAQLRSESSSSFLLRLNWEAAGNVTNLLSKAFSATPKIDEFGDEYNEVFGTRYAQYFRLDGSISNRIELGPATSIAWRLYGGAGFSYGNANAIPYDRLFYSGGSNSMRGWVARSLGPGNADPYQTDNDGNGSSIRYYNQVGNLKLEANAEVRFPVWGMLNGAVFFDLGNVWYLRERTSQPEAVFHLDSFYRQLGFNTGIGFRFDIGMAILRFDWGWRLHDPNQPKGERWTKSLGLGNSTLNFGVGYPF